MSGSPVLVAERVSKRFGGVVALAGVSLAARAGRVTCLLGDNGAGKSTLIKILAGVWPPSGGRILLDGRAVALRSPRDARDRGIATVYQDLAVIPLMSVWRNFFLGAEPTWGRGPFERIDVAACARIALEELTRLGLHLDDAGRAVATLSGGERQGLAIARALHFGARVLILDEPTAALGVNQAARVLELLGRTRERGVAVVFVTHSPQHAMAVGDRFVVLRRGELASEMGREEASVEVLARLMGGGTA